MNGVLLLSRQKMISVLALLLTAGYVAFVLPAPASVTKPATQALVVGLLIACLVTSLRTIHQARRAAHRNQPHPEHPQPPSPPAP